MHENGDGDRRARAAIRFVTSPFNNGWGSFQPERPTRGGGERGATSIGKKVEKLAGHWFAEIDRDLRWQFQRPCRRVQGVLALYSKALQESYLSSCQEEGDK